MIAPWRSRSWIRFAARTRWASNASCASSRCSAACPTPRSRGAWIWCTTGELDILALEYVEGETLQALLSRGRLPPERALEFAQILADALRACHAQGVLHRDLKPANIMIHPERGPGDPGLWCCLVQLRRQPDPHRRGDRLPALPRAPRVFSGAPADPRSDIYALGAILFEMLTGRPIHLVESVAELVEAHRSAAPPSVYQLRPEVGPRLSAVITRAIAPQPELRFATIQELQSGLRTLNLPAGRELQARLPCERCQTPLIIDLDLCPGCGKTVGWELKPGPYAVQLTRVRDPERTARWLKSRYGHALKKGLVTIRLRHTPTPLVVGAAPASAEQLAEEARKTDADAEVIRARAVLGARLQVANATIAEALSALALHFIATLLLGPILVLLGAKFTSLALLPAAIGAVGIIGARRYVRRPLLLCKGERPQPQLDRAQLQARLSALKNDRARRLAASAIARAAPILLGDLQGLPKAAHHDAMDALDRALTAAAQADAQLSYLSKRSRARLGAQISAAQAQLEAGKPEAQDKLHELEQEKKEDDGSCVGA